MKLPFWVHEEIAKFTAPPTGKVELVLEFNKGVTTRIEIGGFVRIKPDGETVKPLLREKDPSWCRKCGSTAFDTWYICAKCDKEKREPSVKY